jgi:hypothetical protein
MTWLNNNQSQAAQAAPAAQGVKPAQPEQPEIKHTFDVPVKFRLLGVAEPIAATLLHIALSGCRFRTWMLLQKGTALSFDWRLSSGKVLAIHGTVAARYAPRNGGVGFEYAIALKQIEGPDADALASEAAMLQRKSSSARSYDTSLIDISQFTGYRVPGDFAVSYKGDDPRIGAKIAQASDLTGNALRLRCGEPMRAQQVIQLSLRLPDRVLDVHKGKDDDMVVGPHGYRRVPRKYLRRPFEELKLRGRILGQTKDSQNRDAYEVELLEVSGLAREEIARYIHASQLASLKR